MDILNKIAELAIQGYTVSFKNAFPNDCTSFQIEMTYLRFYHAMYILAFPCEVPESYIGWVLDDLKEKIGRLVEEKQNDQLGH